MTEDENRQRPRLSSADEYPPLIRRFEDDPVPETEESFLRERRVDRHHYGSASGETGAARHREHSRKKEDKRSRVLAVAVLVLVAIAIGVTGATGKTALFGGSGTQETVPFNLVPMATDTTTSGAGSDTTTSSTTSSSTTTSTTTTSAPATTASVAEVSE